MVGVLVCAEQTDFRVISRELLPEVELLLGDELLLAVAAASVVAEQSVETAVVQKSKSGSGDAKPEAAPRDALWSPPAQNIGITSSVLSPHSS